MSAVLRAGIAGFGGAGLAQFDHFEALGCEVVAVYDPEPSAHKRAKEKSPSVIATADFDEFLKSGIDIVAVCSPDRTHAEYFVRSIRAGKHVISEKPLTDSLDGCRQILKAVAEAPHCVAAVQHQMRFLPVHLEMKKLVAAGELGRIAYLEGYYIHNLTERGELYHMWRFEDNATPLVYSGCHFVDFLRWLLDDEVVEVMGMANNIAFPKYPESDTNVVLLRFRSGIVGKVVTAFGFGRPQDHSVRVYGNEKCIENNLLFSKDGSFTIFARPQWPKPISDRNLRAQYAFWRSSLKTMTLSRIFEKLFKTRHIMKDYSISSYPLRLYEHNQAVRTSIKDFIEAIQTKRQPLCTVLDAAKTVAVCLAGVEAYRTGHAISLEKYWLPEFGEFVPKKNAI